MATKSKSDHSQHEQFSFVEIENNIRKYWHEHSIESKLKERCSSGKKFYFLDGPPYTAGKIIQ
jgi:isoleucyl-tRNA synthetase